MNSCQMFPYEDSGNIIITFIRDEIFFTLKPLSHGKSCTIFLADVPNTTFLTFFSFFKLMINIQETLAVEGDSLRDNNYEDI